MQKVRVAINGFGRIGRAFYKLAWERDDIEVVAVNDLGTIESLSYLLKYDSVYGRAPFIVDFSSGNLVVTDGTKKLETKFISSKEPSGLPWRELNIDVVVESTGLFTSYEKAKFHIDQGAKHVVISAPSKDEANSPVITPTILLGVNEEKFGTCEITSNASCTTNASSPLIAVLHESLGIEKAILNTVHGYTASQSLVDGPSKKDLREGRAAAENIVPSSTGAAIAVTKAFPALTGKFDGISIRVPVPVGSLVDITFISKRPTSVEEVNKILTDASMSSRWKGLLTVTDEPIVSSDIVGVTIPSIVDLEMTRVVDGNLVKVMAWYDNEMGYTATLIRHVLKVVNK
jgi:glyceraldehyde 3-phosphate dehydrogenase